MGSVTQLILTDLESGTTAINAPRTGSWFTFGDGTNTTPPLDLPSSSGYAGSDFYARFSCTGGTNVGAGFELNRCGSKSYPYDVSAYTGITLAYKSSHDLRVTISTVATTPPPNGTCVTTCYNHHGHVLSAAPSWTLVTIPFAALTQDFGAVSVFDKTKVLDVQFVVSGVWNEMAGEQDSITPAAVEFGVDEIEFTH